MILSQFFFHRYDDDLDEVEEEDHFEDVDDLEVKTTAFALWMNPTRPYLVTTIFFPYIFCNSTLSKLQKMYRKIEVFSKLITDFFALQI